MADDPLRLDNQLCFALYAANRAVNRLYTPLLEALDLTYPQYLVMLTLWESERAGTVPTVSSIGVSLRLDSGTLTPLLKRLAGRGLLERRRSSVDERSVEVILTEEGRRLRERALRIPEELLCRSGLDLDDAAGLRDSLHGLLAQLDESASQR